MKKYTIPGVFLVMISSVLQAQSYHFSQFFSTPLLTNPANTGLIDGPYRIASNFRSQGKSGASPFFTGYVSADASLLNNSLPRGHKAGAGVFVMTDKTLGGASQTNSVGLSAAYHVGLDEYGENSIGLGFQGTYNQRRVDFNRLSFGSQFGFDGYDATLPTGETINNTNRAYFDVNAGLVYQASLENASFFVGGAVYNILRHKDNMIADEFKMPTRYVVQAGGQVFAGEFAKLYFSLTNMGQAKANETTAGGAFGLQLTEREIKNEINFGVWYRYKDAIIPYIGYYYDSFQIGLSYDYTVSDLKTASQVKNGYELTLIYKAGDKAKLKTQVPWY
jgi:type IX secretion system PorP/SprF family membrane protein